MPNCSARACLTDLKVAGAFPTDHPLHGPDPAIAFAPEEGVEFLRDADVILSLDWWDQATLFRQAWGEDDVRRKSSAARSTPSSIAAGPATIWG